MQTEQVIAILTEREGMRPDLAERYARARVNFNPDILEAFNRWIEKGEISEIQYCGVSIPLVMKKAGVTFLDALMKMQVLMESPENAQDFLSKEDNWLKNM